MANTLSHTHPEDMHSVCVGEPKEEVRQREGERKHIENADKMIFTYGVIKLSIINKMKII